MSEAAALRWEVMSYSEKKAAQASAAFALVTNAGQSAESIINSALLGFAGAALDSLAKQLPAYLTKNGSLAFALKTLDITDVDTIIEGEIANDYKNIVIALKAGLGQGVGGIHANLYETLTGTNQMLQSYRSLVQKIAIDPYIQRWANFTYTPNIASDETAWFMNKIGALSDKTYAHILNLSGWDDSWKAPLEQAWTRQPPIDMLLTFRRRGYIDDATLKALLKWFRMTDDAIASTMGLVTQYPEPYRLAEMQSKALVGDTEYLATTRLFGLDDFWAERWAEAQVRYPDITTALALLRRGVIDEATFLLWSQREQMRPEDAEAVITLQDVIPPIQDLIRFAVREAYGDHKSETQYPAMVAMAKKMGLSSTSAALYWYAHWDRIPVSYMFANYHRGLWDKDKLLAMLRIVDVHPDDREDIVNVAFSPPSIRELGYGYDVGVYTEADITKYRRFGGLSPEDAEKSTKALVAYRLEGERNAVRMEYLYAYSRAELTEEELTDKLKEIKTPAEAIPLWIERAKLYAERILKPTTDVEGKLVSGTEALTAFKLNLKDETWLRTALKDLNWTDDRVEVAVQRAILEKAETAVKDEEAKYRKLTLAQLQQMFKLQLISTDSFTTELVLLGYSPDDAELLMKIYTQPAAITAAIKNYTVSDAARLYHYQLFDEEDIYDNFLGDGYDDTHAAVLTLLTRLNLDYPILASLYEKGYINTDDLKAELIKMGMSEIDAINLINRTVYEYQVSRLATEKDLTKAEIIKGAKNNVLTPSQAAELLQGIGYDQNEAYYILAINKVVSAGDPEGYWDMRKVTESYKKARGEKYMDIPDELIMLDKQQKQLKAQLDEAKKHPEKEQEIADLTIKLGTIEQQMKQLIIAKKLT